LLTAARLCLANPWVMGAGCSDALVLVAATSLCIACSLRSPDETAVDGDEAEAEVVTPKDHFESGRGVVQSDVGPVLAHLGVKCETNQVAAALERLGKDWVVKATMDT